MANVTLASNYKETVGKWVPYYYKPFNLGRIDDGNGSTDGETYITQIAGGDDNVIKFGYCNSSVNCNFYYYLEFTDDGDHYIVHKYTLSGQLTDTIYASNDGSNHAWAAPTYTNDLITIDVGVAVMFISITNSEDGDIYRINLPTFDQMERRKIYHGGYASFLRMPYTENISFNSDIIPINLMNKNVSIAFNPMIMLETGSSGGGHGALNLAKSREDITANRGITLALNWNVNKDGAHSTQASSTAFIWPSGGEEWSYGSMIHNDIETINSLAGGNNDFPAHAHLAASDLNYSVDSTGSINGMNVTLSGRAGFCKMNTEFVQGAGGSIVSAYNQFWPCILMIS